MFSLTFMENVMGSGKVVLDSSWGGIKREAWCFGNLSCTFINDNATVWQTYTDEVSQKAKTQLQAVYMNDICRVYLVSRSTWIPLVYENNSKSCLGIFFCGKMIYFPFTEECWVFTLPKEWINVLSLAFREQLLSWRRLTLLGNFTQSGTFLKRKEVLLNCSLFSIDVETGK